MNKVILMGRLTRDPDIRYTQGENSMCVARYTLAVDRRRRSAGEETQADFISCVAFGRSGEFAEKYFHKGIKIAVQGRLQTGSYTNKDGVRVYTTDVIVDDQEFAESRTSSGSGNGNWQAAGRTNTAGSGRNGQGQAGTGSRNPGRQAENRQSAIDDFVNDFDNIGGIDEELPFS